MRARRSVRWWAYTIASLVWFVAITLPAWMLYLGTLGAVTLEFYFMPRRNWIEITIPGWSGNTFTYGMITWRPF